MSLKIVSGFKKFGQKIVLNEVNFQLPMGKISAIVGESGAGKSTLLKIMGLLIKPDSGEVYFNHLPTSCMSNKQLANIRLLSIGFIFQEYNLIGHLTALENVMLPALLAKKSSLLACSLAKKLLLNFGLSDKEDSKACKLSGGQEQRVAMARALINNPQIIIGDEPTASLDKKNKWLFLDQITELNQTTGQTFLIVTHDQEVCNVANIVFHMKDGQLKRQD